MSPESQPASRPEPINASGPRADRKVEWKPWSPDRTRTPEPDPAKRGRFGRLTTSAGIALLCLAFFLPQVKGCRGTEVIPADEAMISGGTFVLFLGLPFLFGFGLAVLYFWRYVFRLVPQREVVDAAARLFCVLLLIWASVLTGNVVLTSDSQKTEDTTGWLSLTGEVWLGMAAALAVSVIWRREPVRRPICVLCCAVPALWYFMLWREEACYGLRVSVTACVLIAVGSAWEAVRTVRQAWASP